MLRVLKWLLVLLAVLAALVTAWLWRPLPLAMAPGAVVLDLTVPPGSSAQQVAQASVNAGVMTPVWALQAWFRLSGQARQIQAGSYEIVAGTTPRDLLGQLVRGEQAVRKVALLEGWTWRQVQQALRDADHLRFDLPEGGDPALWLRGVGVTAVSAEGRFFPDTYVYPKNSNASDVLRQAARAMDQRLQQAWAARAPDLPLRNPDEALILASLVEKETGHGPDRAQIAGVFINRLRLGMRLQTDPSVIFGLGDRFDGNLRRTDLATDTPYNTYTRAGLPPTPIALPGAAALHAAVRPAATPALYFVARGDGSSQFSATLSEHNQAVRRYQLKP